jgi:hypothetical protein
MKIEEIRLLGSFTPDHVKSDQIRRGFLEHEDEMTVFGRLNSIEIYFHDEKDGYLRFYFVKDELPVGYTAFSPSYYHRGFWYAVTVWIDPSIRGNRLMANFYQMLLNRGYKLVSDFEQTQSGKMIWKTLWRMGTPIWLVPGNPHLSHPSIPVKTDDDFESAYEAPITGQLGDDDLGSDNKDDYVKIFSTHPV